MQVEWMLCILLELSNVERVMRIELTYQAWEARVLPLNYTRICI
jgi:hypothetical protein